MKTGAGRVAEDVGWAAWVPRTPTGRAIRTLPPACTAIARGRRAQRRCLHPRVGLGLDGPGRLDAQRLASGARRRRPGRGDHDARSVAYDSLPSAEDRPRRSASRPGDAAQALAWRESGVAQPPRRDGAVRGVGGADDRSALMASRDLAERDESRRSACARDELIDSAGARRRRAARAGGRRGPRGPRWGRRGTRGEAREAHRLFTEIGATGHAERVAGELAALAR